MGWKVEEIYRCFIAIRADLRLGELALHAGLARDGMQVADTQQLNLRRGVRVGGVSAFPKLPACCSSTQVASKQAYYWMDAAGRAGDVRVERGGQNLPTGRIRALRCRFCGGGAVAAA